MNLPIEALKDSVGVFGEAAQLYVDEAQLASDHLEPPVITDKTAAAELNLDLVEVSQMRRGKRQKNTALIALKREDLQAEAEAKLSEQHKAWESLQADNNAAALGIAVVARDDEALEVLAADSEVLARRNKLRNFSLGIAQFLTAETEDEKQAAEFSARSSVSELPAPSSDIAQALVELLIDGGAKELAPTVEERVEAALAERTKYLQLRHDRLDLSVAEALKIIASGVVIKIASEQGIDVSQQLRVLTQDLFRDGAQHRRGAFQSIVNLRTVLASLHDIMEPDEPLFDDLLNTYFKYNDSGYIRTYFLHNFGQNPKIVAGAKQLEVKLREELIEGRLTPPASGQPVDDFIFALQTGNDEQLMELVGQLPKPVRMLGYLSVVAVSTANKPEGVNGSARFPVRPIGETIEAVDLFINLRQTVRDITESGGYESWKHAGFTQAAMDELPPSPSDFEDTPDRIMALARQKIRDLGSDSNTAAELRELMGKL